MVAEWLATLHLGNLLQVGKDHTESTYTACHSGTALSEKTAMDTAPDRTELPRTCLTQADRYQDANDLGR